MISRILSHPIHPISGIIAWNIPNVRARSIAFDKRTFLVVNPADMATAKASIARDREMRRSEKYDIFLFLRSYLLFLYLRFELFLSVFFLMLDFSLCFFSKLFLCLFPEWFLPLYLESSLLCSYSLRKFLARRFFQSIWRGILGRNRG